VEVKWLRTALANLDAEAAYVARDNAAAAAQLVQRIYEVVEQLKQYPSLGRAGRVAGTRELVVSHTPYIVPYRVRGTVVEILRLLHGARRWPFVFDR
jgi:addiction module RelE/StbE family toxin